LLGEDGIRRDNAPGRQEFERRMEGRRLEETDGPGLKELRRGWCLGSEGFKKQMLEQIEKRQCAAARMDAEQGGNE